MQPETVSPETFPSHVEIRDFVIAQRNLERRKQAQYKYAKFFKHRQPTTSRKTWKPNVQIEEEKKE